ncbi:MAG: GNAT family N-acetyltransferase [Clostridia bacterium]|jgi:predicted N-acetyltransferase YhbS|nr:GNAT family N-acetyltransferase [Clostridia bacterium]
MKIVKATQIDVARIKQLIDTNFDAVIAKHHSKEVVQKFKQQNSLQSITNQLNWKQVFVLRENEAVHGTIAFTNFGTEELPKYSLSNVFVDVSEHGKGLGRKLVDFVIDIARGQGIDILHVPSTMNAVAFYEKFGFIVDERQPDAEDEITWMTMEL